MPNWTRRATERVRSLFTRRRRTPTSVSPLSKSIKSAEHFYLGTPAQTSSKSKRKSVLYMFRSTHADLQQVFRTGKSIKGLHVARYEDGEIPKFITTHLNERCYSGHTIESAIESGYLVKLDARTVRTAFIEAENYEAKNCIIQLQTGESKIRRTRKRTPTQEWTP